MNEERKLELLAYAKVCFEHSTSPFAHTHLTKKNVTADEINDLSNIIAGILGDEIDLRACSTALKNGRGLLGKELVEQAEKAFMETQKE